MSLPNLAGSLPGRRPSWCPCPPAMRTLLSPCRLIAAILLAGASGLPLAAGETPAFERDVMAVLSKAGCNLGACHGNQNGKGGFKLSLRGQDPQADFEALVRGADQRRVNLLDPEASLILQKPTARVVHQG